MRHLLWLFAGTLLISSIGSTAAHAVTLLGPSPYLQFSDSPFSGLSFSYFHLEDFEDGLFNVPGVSASSNTLGVNLGPVGPSNIADSVDGDDGVVNGLGTAGREFSSTQNLITDNLGYTFTFDANTLGVLPTHAGIVWTDGSPTASTQVEFFGPTGNSLGVIGPVKISDNSFAGTTAEDRFFGVVSLDGISRFVIRSPGGQNNLAVDHLQYGFVPEPSSLTILLITIGIITARTRRA